VIYLASIIIGRPHFKLNTLFSAAFIILIIDPTAIFDLSFRLSFMSVLGILAIHHFYPLHIHSFKDKLFTSLKTTAIATVFTLPLIINSFGILSLLAVPANLIFIPLVEFIIIPMGLISFIIFNISTSASLYVIELNNQLIGFFISYVQSLASLSLASITVPYLNSLSTTLYYLSVFLIFFTLSAKTKRLQFITLIFVMGFICSFSFGHFMNWKYKNFEAYILDSGARNTVLIKTKSGSDVLILSGSSRFNQNGFIEKNIVTSFLLKSGVSGLEYIILTEINEDILEGAAHLIRKFGVKYLWTNGAELNSDIWEEIKSGKVKWLNLQRDYEPLHLGNVKLEILFPKLKNSKFNQYSAADVLISHNNKYFLISNNPVDSQILVNTPAEIIFWPYIKNEALLNKVLSSSA
ncbi:MAG: hypothetical protein GTN99_05240, partial [Candidatus Dadabacteria bacterium]|nr:hypothetical protein [Candidatus Dadabacteria bacterium]NIT13650.1 hypothetical protein [Candidatus Dadabacteria bacterium]